ncbi:MAG: hypothetical protein ACFBSF_17410 [Leptolyngbyaceae cyanobacterium]
MAEPSLAWNADRFADGGLRVPGQGFTPSMYHYGPVEQTCAEEEAHLTHLQTRVGLL